ncbi:MAG: methyltransferase [Oscillospiraceae bacterium]|nr:methyltransferase [Oscillospiraceae bacterium]
MKAEIENIGGFKLITSPEHRFGADAFLIAAFSKPEKSHNIADLCTGCGIIPFYLMRYGIEPPVYAVDIEKNAIELLESSAALNNLEKNIVPVLADLRSLKGLLPFNFFDLITANPPYKPAGTGKLPCSAAAKTANHETSCTFEDVCESAAKLLRPGGRFCVCMRPERLASAFDALRQNKIEPKRLRFVSDKPSSAPFLALIEGRKCGKKDGLATEPQLCIRNEKGAESEEMKKIYNP